MERRFMVYIVFFMLSIYISGHYKSMLAVMKADKNWGESDYNKLFKYQMEKPENDDNYDFEDGVGKDDDDMDGSIFRKKKVYYY